MSTDDSFGGLAYNGARLAAAGTLWRLLFGPTVELPEFATDGGTTIDLHAAVSNEAEADEAGMILSSVADQARRDPHHAAVRQTAMTTRPEVGRVDAPGGSERWRALRIMRDERRKVTGDGAAAAAAAASDDDDDDDGSSSLALPAAGGGGEDILAARDAGGGGSKNKKAKRKAKRKAKASPLTAPKLAPDAPPTLKAAAHQVVRLLVLLVRRSWGKKEMISGGGAAAGGSQARAPLDGVRLGDDDASAAALLLEHLVYDSLSLGVIEHSAAAAAANSDSIVSGASLRVGGGGQSARGDAKTAAVATSSWGFGLARAAMGMLSSSVASNDDDAGNAAADRAAAAAAATTRTTRTLRADAADVDADADGARNNALGGFDASIFMTPANGVQPLVDMLRGGGCGGGSGGNDGNNGNDAMSRRTDQMLLEALRPSFQALSLHTKLAVAEGGAHDELMSLIGTGGCGDLMIHLLINRGETGTGASMSGEVGAV